MQFAKYSKVKPSASQIDGVKKCILANHSLEQGGSTLKTSYANVLKGSKLPSSKTTIYAHQEPTGVGEDWLSRSAIAKLPSLRSVESIIDSFISEGVLDIQVRPLGAKFVVLTFASENAMKDMIEGPDVNWLGNFFEECRKWSPDLSIEVSHTVWISCYGVPLHLWNSDTFFRIGGIWGEPITLDEATSNRFSFSCGRVQICTNVFGSINDEINLEDKGRVYPIKVMEDHGTFSSRIKDLCKCDCKVKGRASFSSKNSFLDDDDIDLKEGEKAEVVVANIANDENSTGNADTDLEAHVRKVDGSCSNSESQSASSPFLSRPVIADPANSTMDNARIHGDEDLEAYIRRVDGLDSKFVCLPSDLVSSDPLINYVEYKRKKKKKNMRSKDNGVELVSKVDESVGVVSSQGSEAILRAPHLEKGASDSQVEGSDPSVDLNPTEVNGRSITLSWDEYSQKNSNHQEEAFQVQSQRRSKKIIENSAVPNKAILFKNARKMLDVGALLGIEIKGGRKHNLKRLAERENILKKHLEECEDSDKDDEASISLEF